ncbi:hypothetical protein ACIPMT_18520 [Streptomyces griseus]|uniref:hypothetical protein n=1 Tax=Streptomyces griseus TaxID=1911 RepID=UPI00380F1362
MHRPSLLTCATALVAVLAAGCSSPDPDPKVPRASPSSYDGTSGTSEPSPTSSGAGSLGAATQDLRDMDWARTAVPGDFCDVPGLISFTSGEATVRSDTHGSVHAEQYVENVVYGDVLGDERVEAALRVGCDTGGETGGGRLAWAFVVFTGEQGRLRLVGTVTPQKYEGGHASGFDGVELASGRVTAKETWHRELDATCCPSGKAVTVWRVGADGLLVAGEPRVTG